MKAEIKSYHSPDIYDLENYNPEQKDCFGFLLTILIGPIGERGGESLDFVVCTPKYLLKEYAELKNAGSGILNGGVIIDGNRVVFDDDVLFGKDHIIVFEYNFEKILRNIKKLIDSVEEDTWDIVGEKLSRYGQWEFQDYDKWKDKKA